eukprot:6726626-Prymnesium_polylepis.1
MTGRLGHAKLCRDAPQRRPSPRLTCAHDGGGCRDRSFLFQCTMGTHMTAATTPDRPAMGEPPHAPRSTTIA